MLIFYLFLKHEEYNSSIYLESLINNLIRNNNAYLVKRFYNLLRNMIDKSKMSIYYLKYIGFFIARVAKKKNSYNRDQVFIFIAILYPGLKLFNI